MFSLAFVYVIISYLSSFCLLLLRVCIEVEAISSHLIWRTAYLADYSVSLREIIT